MKECVLYDRVCIECGECNMCDLNPNKVCDNCEKCLELEDSEYLSLEIDEIDDSH